MSQTSSFGTLKILPIVLYIASCLVGCGQRTTAVPDELVLYSIDGTKEPIEPVDGETFNKYPVLGKLKISDPADRQKIMAALDQAVAASDGTMNRCFWPRHGIRAARKGKTNEYTICFQCLQMSISDGADSRMVPITKSPQQLFNSYLTEAGIPIAP